MTLLDIKEKTLALIEELEVDKKTHEVKEELTKDPDLFNKMNDVINQVQYELIRIKKIPAYVEFEVKKNDLIKFSDIKEKTNDDVYQIDIVRGIDIDYKAKGTIIKCLEDGIIEIEYFKYPKHIDRETPDDYEFELSPDVLEIMPYGVAGDILKSSISDSYGNIYSDRYQQMLSNLDIRYNMGDITLEEVGGLEW